MGSSKIIDDNILSDYTSGNTVADKVKGLIAQQKTSWELAGKNYSDLNNVERKTFEYDSFKIVIQFNPGRITSSSAKVDSKSIKERPCFLCVDNLPSEQKGLLYKDDYLILVNPFPIFKEHFTIPSLKHQPQSIASGFSNMLDLAKDLSKHYTVFYNGPKCGASAPDHIHFQACSKETMPIEKEIESVLREKENLLFSDSNTAVYGVENYLRYLFIIESKNKESALNHFNNLQSTFQNEANSTVEPMMNIIVLYDTSWKILVFPRAKHRPSQYFLEGKDRILSSPAAVDFGGLFITPRKEDFDKMSMSDIKDIFKQTSVQQDIFKNITENYINSVQ
ncbi:MAG: DUF4922 domain-containing protein [Bacteroidota bacterium]